MTTPRGPRSADAAERRPSTARRAPAPPTNPGGWGTATGGRTPTNRGPQSTDAAERRSAPRNGRRITQGELIAMARRAGQKHGIDPRLIQAIVMTEAPSLQADIRGDSGKSVGLAQIHRAGEGGRPTVAQAADPNFAIDYIAKRMADFKRKHPRAPLEALVLQHNNPSAATALAKGQISVQQANQRSGTGRYVTDVMSKLPGSGRTGTVTTGTTTGFAPNAGPGTGGGRLPGAGAPGGGMPAGAANGSVQSILDLGMKFLGQPYKWGGSTPEAGFDCSGLLQYIYGRNGVQLPRVSSQQAQAGTGVALADAQPGDLVAFDNSSERPGIDHIGVYLGNGKMLQAPRTGRNIEVVNVDLRRAKAIRRVLGPQAYAGLPKKGNKFVYTAGATPGATPPEQITPMLGGGDVGNDPARFLGEDGKVDPNKAIAEYGYIAELAKSVPDIKKVLTDAIAGGWDADRFLAAIQQTKWWKTTSNTQRQVEELKKTNPGEYKRQRQLMIDSMVVIARNLGVEEGNQRIFILAERALANGWSQDEVQRYLAADVKVANPDDPKAKPNTGQVAVTVDSLKEQAAQYGVPLSQQTLQMWTTQVLRGMVPMESFQSYLKEQAKSLFPGLSKAIDSGITVEQYTNPYRELIAQTLEVNPGDVTMTDPRIQKALYNMSKDGTRTQMTLSDFQEYLRTTPEFTKTRQAQESAAGFVNTITELFGATA